MDGLADRGGAARVGQSHAGADPLGARPGRRPGPRPQGRRRRLSDQALCLPELMARLEVPSRAAAAGGKTETKLKVGELEIDLLARGARRGTAEIERRVSSACWNIWRARRPGRDADDAAGAGLGLSFRSADQRHRRAYSRLRSRRSTRASQADAAHRPRSRIHDLVTAFGNLIRTTAFRLTLVYYFALFALFDASLLALSRLEYASANHRADHQHGQRRDHEADRHISPARPALAWSSRSIIARCDPGANLYLVTDRGQDPLPAMSAR